MSEPATLSMVVPVFGRVALAKRAIDSIAAQNVADLEIIVVDNGSAPPFVARENILHGKKLVLIRHEENLGPAAARKAGIAAASGTWIGFLDSDDRLLPDTLAGRLSHAQRAVNTGGQNPTVFACGWCEADESGRHLRSRVPVASTNSADFFSGCWFCPGSAILAKREVFAAVIDRLETRFRRLEDLDWFAELALDGLVLRVDPTIGVEIRRSAPQGDDRASQATAKAIIGLLEKWQVRFASGAVSKRHMRRLRGYLELERAVLYWRRSQPAMAALAVLRSFLSAPRLGAQLSPGWTEPVQNSTQVVDAETTVND